MTPTKNQWWWMAGGISVLVVSVGMPLPGMADLSLSQGGMWNLDGGHGRVNNGLETLDEASIAELRAKLETSRQAWLKIRDACQGNYEYDIKKSAEEMYGGSGAWETTIVVRNNRVVAEKVRDRTLPRFPDAFGGWQTKAPWRLRDFKTIDDLYADTDKALHDKNNRPLLWITLFDARGIISYFGGMGTGGFIGARIDDVRPWDGTPDDECLADDLHAKLKASQEAWRKFRDGCQGNYEYQFTDRYFTGDTGTTTIVVRHNRSPSREWHINHPGPIDAGHDDKTLAALRQQINSLEKVSGGNIDWLYKSIDADLAGGIRSYEEWSASFHDNGLIRRFGYRDRRLGKEAPFIGARIDIIRPNAEWLRKYDLNHNGQADPDETARAKVDLLEEEALERQKLELARREEEDRKQRQQDAKWLPKYDFNGNGKLDPEEHQRAEADAKAGIVAPARDE